MSATVTGYPMTVSVEAPDRFQRIQILLRIFVYWAIMYLPMGFVLFSAPVVSAVLISQRGGKGFLENYGALYEKALCFVLGTYAWLYYATDEFPRWGGDGACKVRVRPKGEPGMFSALSRYVTVAPHVVVIWLLFIFAVILGLVGVFTVLFWGRVPSFVRRFELAFVAYNGRTLAYYVSLVDDYPPFTLRTNP